MTRTNISDERYRATKDTKFARSIARVLRYSLLPKMIWFFDKEGERLRYEITHDRATGKYRVIVTRPDGSESTEEVDQPTDLIERSVQLMNAIRTAGWKVG